MLKRAIVAALAIAGLAAASLPVRADDYPTRTVTIVVPYPAGGPTDQAARLIANSLSQQFNQSVIVENVTGGGTIIATNKVAKSTPDGYTLLVHNLQISANPTLYKHLPFDTAKDLQAVALINRNPLVLVGRKSLEPKNLTELLADMKKKTLKAAIPGFGATGHLATVLLEQQSHTKVDLIPYRGGTPVVNDLLGQHVDLFFGTPQQLLQHVKVGNMKAYGVTSKERMAELPQAESFVTLFGPKMEFHYWQAMFAPAGTPKPIVDKLNAAVQKVLADPKVLKVWHAEGVSTFPQDERSVAAAEKFFNSEMARWGVVIRENNIHIDQ